MPPPDQPTSFDQLNSAPQAKAVFVKTGVLSRKIRTYFDSFAAGVVWVGGISTIVSIMGIFVYLLIEVIPLFTAPAEGPQESFSLSEKQGAYKR